MGGCLLAEGAIWCNRDCARKRLSNRGVAGGFGVLVALQEAVHVPRPWSFAAFDDGVVRSLAAQLKLPPMLAQLLAARGVTQADEAHSFLNAKLSELIDPNRLPGISQAADRVLAAIKSGRRITIYGDYDVDGVTSTSMLWHCLKLAGAQVDYHIPHRLGEGYGLNCEALTRIHELDPQSLVITVDCGIASVVEAEHARSLPLELIVTDHHQIGPVLPCADVLVHPRLPGTDYPFGDLCGAGVAFKLAWAICQRLGDGKKAPPRLREFLLSAMGLAAIGTIADVVPLRGENRLLVRYGLESLRERACLGLRELFKVAEIEDVKRLKEEDIGFGIAPRINAVGRLGQARLAVELLTTEQQDRASTLALYLEEQNRVRQTVERRILKDAREMLDAKPAWAEGPAIVLAHADWHAGVIGIVASRLVELYQKPVVLLALHPETGMGQGSGRTFARFNLYEGLHACAPLLTTFGGHHAAAGLKLEASRIDAFRDRFCQHVADTFRPTDGDRHIPIDLEVRLADLTFHSVSDLDRLGPYGQGNPRPVLACTQVELAEPPKKVGGGERHLSLAVKQHNRRMKAVSFGNGEWADEIARVQGPIAICFKPFINHFRGYESVELQLIDWQPTAQLKAQAATAPHFSRVMSLTGSGSAEETGTA